MVMEIRQTAVFAGWLRGCAIGTRRPGSKFVSIACNLDSPGTQDRWAKESPNCGSIMVPAIESISREEEKRSLFFSPAATSERRIAT